MRREPTIDWARGVASVLMIEGHAFHGWIAATDKETTAYQLTRIVATLPLPAFLVLAGTAVAYRMRAAIARSESARALRAALLRRGLQVMAAGYAVNLAYAWLDGSQGLATLLRADVLQVIGLSLCTLGLCAGHSGPPRPGAFVRRAGMLGLAMALACPFVAEAWPNPPRALQPLVGLVVDVPGITRMPLVPLFSWAAVGFLAGAWLTAPVEHSGARSPTLRLVLLASLGLALAWVGRAASLALLEAQGGALSRGHIAIVPSIIEYAGRGLVVLGLGPLLVSRLPPRLRAPFRDFGQASLWAYVFHIPFCYGALGAPLRDRLGMAEATPWVLLLIVASYGVVKLRLDARDRQRRLPALQGATG